FLYLAYTLPHANNEAGKNGMEVPSDAPYSDQPWPQAQKNHAAMITRLDRDIGTVLKRLDDLGLAKNTVVFFSSDNGPHKEGGGDPTFFHSSEFHERGTQQALRSGDWKLIYRPFAGDTKGELFDLKNDGAETKNVAKDHPEIVKRMEMYLKTARTESKDYPMRAANKKKG